MLVVPVDELVADLTSASVFFASAGGGLVVVAVVDCIDVDVIAAVVALEVPPDTTLVTLVTEVGLVVDVVVDVVAILMGSVLAVLVADSVTTAVVAAVVVVVLVPMPNTFFLA